MTVKIERLRSGDENTACRTVVSVKPEEERHGVEVETQYMERFLSSDSNYLMIAQSDGEPVGYAVAYRLPRVDRDQDMMYIHEIEVAENYRGRGIGRGIIREVIRCCRDEGYLKMFVITDKDNVPAVRLYESTGGQFCGEDPVVFNFDFEKLRADN